MSANPVAWKMHLCRNAAHWHGGQVACAHTEFLALLAQVGRTPQPVDVTIWTDSWTASRHYEKWLESLGLALLPEGLAIRVLDLHNPFRPLEVEYDGSAELRIWEDAIERAIDAAVEPLENVYPDFPPAWLSEYQRTPSCLVLAVCLDDAP